MEIKACEVLRFVIPTLAIHWLCSKICKSSVIEVTEMVHNGPFKILKKIRRKLGYCILTFFLCA